MESNDSPEIPDRGETSDIPGLPSRVQIKTHLQEEATCRLDNISHGAVVTSFFWTKPNTDNMDKRIIMMQIRTHLQEEATCRLDNISHGQALVSFFWTNPNTDNMDKNNDADKDTSSVGSNT